ncbi:hypothetical protein [Streptomyces sp. f150]|uniref:hypothetical protein n=1 Tax=Streptomyces sp. f150 TaxID=1827699 RepID=UPI000BF17C2E|nr:hypothetical protein [Streptomyces sp. f150]
MSAASSPKGGAETGERLIMTNEELAVELLTTSQCMTHGKADAHRLLQRLRADWRAEDGDMLDTAPVPGVIEYGTAFRATEQAPVEVHSPTASRDEAASRADRYRDMYPVVHLVQRTVHYGEWTEVAS